MSVYFNVEGVPEVIRLLHEFDRQLEEEVTTALGELAREAVVKAKGLASGEGFDKPGRSGRGTGKLVRDIKFSVSHGRAYLREAAVSKSGYRYPAVFEFGHSKWGHRPFLIPAIEAIEPEAYRRVDETVQHAVDEFNAAV